MTNFQKQILGNGYIKYIGHMGSDETFVEAARMSTGKGFYGWYWEEDTYADCICKDCSTQHLLTTLPTEFVENPPYMGVFTRDDPGEMTTCTNCWSHKIFPIRYPDVAKLLGKKGAKRDLSLLETLYSNRHHTPFEMGELAIEVKAPLFVFREWQRHRTQNYNEFSARYSQMPNEHYLPELERIQKQSKTNKQGSSGQFDPTEAEAHRQIFLADQQKIYGQYDHMVKQGMAKEIARINTPVSRMSKMRAKSDIRNWLGFLSLRMENAAQYEIRMYANAVASLIKQLFPKTFELFVEYDLLGTRFSRTEMKAIKAMALMLEVGAPNATNFIWPESFTDKQKTAFLNKLNREEEYKDVLEKL